MPLQSVNKRRNRLQIHSIHPDGELHEDGLRRAVKYLLRSEGWSFNLQVILADDAELRRLHKTFLGEDSATDVMTFPGDPEDDVPSEIYISLDQARQQAREAGESIQRAVQRLLIHGILHLGGWRDKTAQERREMLAYGERHLEVFSSQ